jgi:hypothetical protein
MNENKGAVVGDFVHSVVLQEYRDGDLIPCSDSLPIKA